MNIEKRQSEWETLLEALKTDRYLSYFGDADDSSRSRFEISNFISLLETAVKPRRAMRISRNTPKYVYEEYASMYESVTFQNWLEYYPYVYIEKTDNGLVVITDTQWDDLYVWLDPDADPETFREFKEL